MARRRGLLFVIIQGGTGVCQCASQPAEHRRGIDGIGTAEAEALALRMPLDAQNRMLWGVQTLGDAVGAPLAQAEPVAQAGHSLVVIAVDGGAGAQQRRQWAFGAGGVEHIAGGLLMTGDAVMQRAAAEHVKGLHAAADA